jgi:3-keto-disaccharide hydrolase
VIFVIFEVPTRNLIRKVVNVARLIVRPLAVVTAFLVLSVALQAAGSEEGWKNLFDGNDLNGWVQHGGHAKYSVQDGEIVGTSVPNTGNSFLCTTRNYSNFILELEFKVQNGLNSGIQVRSECFDQPKAVEFGGKQIKIAAGRVHGYQVEIDPSARAWTGGLYDEGRRGWLVNLKGNQPAREAFKAEKWNTFRIECKGDSIKTWLNGVPATDLHDSVTPSGFIALQVHSVGEKSKPLEVRWRNIRIKELD